jgi:transposase-like protein
MLNRKIIWQEEVDMSSKRESGMRRRWSAEEKARIVRRYLRDRVSLADLSDETGASPAQISQWAKVLLEGAESVFAGEHKRLKRRVEKELRAKEARIAELQEVVSELSTEVLRLKKNPGARLRAGMLM